MRRLFLSRITLNLLVLTGEDEQYELNGRRNSTGPPSGQSNGSGARTRDRRVHAAHRADSLSTVPPTPPKISGIVDH
ncbi:hypothetical protein PoB_004844100 [Plakobranchus ocellatus]|uniref:Secreted protein n=1 Tax=Plakobranchus ocellatus TaxID=259542 RepID=A0AAV4BNA5_9GAST|nr:hypothetical protein PoB_004844100 [Plakobranchus ocellatus]